ncbi:methyltransferase [Lithospermum erythrorhizon]|uniref:Methyltransferase n=1 Tax=Lithospermum erythrorhizon TaxID=34254 RepID=A0AAV3Q2B0_LITER
MCVKVIIIVLAPKQNFPTYHEKPKIWVKYNSMALVHKLLLQTSPLLHPPLRRHSTTTPATTLLNKLRNRTTKNKTVQKQKPITKISHLKRRTRSDKEVDEDKFLKEYGNEKFGHVPVMLAEVLDVFGPLKLNSFVDCTLGAAGHSSAIIQAHPEMDVYVGLDIDPVAHEIARIRINDISTRNVPGRTSALRVHTFQKNFRHIKSQLNDVDEKLIVNGVDGILLDLGMSSMQVCLLSHTPS